jgi:hypothetical protein
MSDALSYSVELAAERSSERYCLEKKLQKFGISYNPLEYRLKMLGIKGLPSGRVVDSLTSLKHNPANILDALIESGYKYYNDDRLIDDTNLSSALYLLDAESDTPRKYFDVFWKLKEKLGYKTVSIPAIGQLNQIGKIFKISKKGDACKVIDFLAEVGYKLGTFEGKGYINFEVDIIEYLTKVDVDTFLKAFYKLKEELGYKSIKQYPIMYQIKSIIEISQLLGYARAIDYLATTGYKVKKGGITEQDIEKIRHISEQLWRKSLEDLTTCLYKDMPGEFMRGFQHLSLEDKKSVIKSIFNCDKTSNMVVITWLDENYPELVREVGLSLV